MRLFAGDVEVTVDTTEENPRTVEAILSALPIESEARTWGEEVYFGIPVAISEENGRQEVEVGEVGYWPAGKAIALFFGRTPISTDDRPKAFENVNVFGRIAGDPNVLGRVKDGDPVRVRRA